MDGCLICGAQHIGSCNPRHPEHRPLSAEEWAERENASKAQQAEWAERAAQGEVMGADLASGGPERPAERERGEPAPGRWETVKERVRAWFSREEEIGATEKALDRRPPLAQAPKEKEYRLHPVTERQMREQRERDKAWSPERELRDVSYGAPCSPDRRLQLEGLVAARQTSPDRGSQGDKVTAYQYASAAWVVADKIRTTENPTEKVALVRAASELGAAVYQERPDHGTTALVERVAATLTPQIRGMGSGAEQQAALTAHAALAAKISQYHQEDRRYDVETPGPTEAAGGSFQQFHSKSEAEREARRLSPSQDYRLERAHDAHGPTDSYVLTTLPAPGAVARDARVEERIRQIEDPEQRARAATLLETIRSEVNASQQQQRERDRAQERGRELER